MSGAASVDRLSARMGYVSKTAAKITVVSLQDTGTLQVTCSGGTPTITTSLTGLGTDHTAYGGAPVLYYAKIDITGLSQDTDYTWTVTKNGLSVSGSFRTMPADGSDFSFVMSTCEALCARSPANSLGTFRSYIETQTSPRVSFYAHIDDTMYPDLDRAFGRPAYRSGDFATQLRLTKPEGTSNGDPEDTGLSADYCINWARYFGLFDDDHYSSAADRLWVQRNVPFVAQWGDHEVASNWNRGVGGSGNWYGGPSGYSALPGFKASPAGFFDDVAAANWEALFGQARPSKLGASGQHWGFTQGPVCFVAVDMNTFADGRHGLTLAAGVNQGTGKQVDGSVSLAGGGVSADLPYLGTQQITDILNFFAASNKPFNILFTENGISSHNEPWGQFWPTDFLDLMQRASIGVLNNPRLNGTTGKLIILKGDTHALHVTSYHSNGTAAGLGGSSYNNLELWEVCPGTLNGSNTAGVLFPYMRYAGKSRRSKSGAASNSRKIHGFVHVIVRASRSPQEMEIRLIDTSNGDHEVLWSGKFDANTTGNAPRRV